GRLITFREQSDTFVCDDLRPAFAEFGYYANRFLNGVRRRWKVRWLSIPFVRNRLQRRARAAVKEARSILFVCLGNICRSPFAEHYARRVLSSGLQLTSSGTYPVAGRSSPRFAVDVAQEWNVALTDHRSQVLETQECEAADIIFSFDENVHEEVQALFP